MGGTTQAKFVENHRSTPNPGHAGRIRVQHRGEVDNFLTLAVKTLA